MHARKLKISPDAKKGPSLSVRQLIDERVAKLEQEELARIDAEFGSQLSGIQNAIKVKTLRAENELQTPLDDVDFVGDFESKISARLDRMERVLRERVKCLASIQAEVPINRGFNADVVEYGIQLDKCNIKISDFDKLVRERYMKELSHRLHPPSHVYEPNVEEYLQEGLIQTFSNKSDSSKKLLFHELDTGSDSVNVKLKLNRPDLSGLFSLYTITNPLQGNDHDHLKSLLAKLTKTDKLANRIHTDVNLEVESLDAKYLRLIAEISSVVFETASRKDLSKECPIDPLIIRRLLPTILQDDDELLQDFVTVIGDYCGTYSGANTKLERLINMERNRVHR